MPLTLRHVLSHNSLERLLLGARLLHGHTPLNPVEESREEMEELLRNDALLVIRRYHHLVAHRLQRLVKLPDLVIDLQRAWANLRDELRDRFAKFTMGQLVGLVHLLDGLVQGLDLLALRLEFEQLLFHVCCLCADVHLFESGLEIREVVVIFCKRVAYMMKNRLPIIVPH